MAAPRSESNVAGDGNIVVPVNGVPARPTMRTGPDNGLVACPAVNAHVQEASETARTWPRTSLPPSSEHLFVNTERGFHHVVHGEQLLVSQSAIAAKPGRVLTIGAKPVIGHPNSRLRVIDE